MNPRKHSMTPNPTPTPTEAPTSTPDHRMNELLAHARRRAWTGPDHSPRVEQHLKGITMNAQSKLPLSRSALILLSVGVVAAGSLAAAVTHSVMSRHATLISEDGTRYEVELAETADGSAGTFVADDGTVYGIDVVEQDGQQNVTVDINSPAGGTSTVILDDGTAPRVTTEPGQTARITIGTSEHEQDTQAKPDDE